MALPDFGLMTKADKQKLDAIDTSTLLTKTEASATYLTQASASTTYLTQAAASETYATKAEMKSYIRQVLESDTGFVFLDGNSSEVGIIPAFKKDPELSISPNSGSSGSSWTFEVSRLGNGAISATSTYSPLIISVEGSTVTAYVSERTLERDAGTEFTVTISVAETDEYQSAEVTLSGFVVEGSPNVPEP